MTQKYAIYGETPTANPKIQDSGGSYLDLPGDGDVLLYAATGTATVNAPNGDVTLLAGGVSGDGIIALSCNIVKLQPFGADALVNLPSGTGDGSEPTDFWSEGTAQVIGLTTEGFRLPRIREKQTTNATPGAIDTHLPNANCVLYVETTVVAKTSDGATVAGFQRTAFFKVIAGVITQIGSTLVPTTDFGGTAWLVDIAVSGSDIAVNVTGAAATTIYWGSFTTYKTVRNGN